MELFISGGARKDLDLEPGLNFAVQVYLGMSEHERFTGMGCIHHYNICIHNAWANIHQEGVRERIHSFGCLQEQHV